MRRVLKTEKEAPTFRLRSEVIRIEKVLPLTFERKGR